MGLLLDENISHRVLRYIGAEFPGSKSIQKEGFSGYKDLQVWDFALKNQLTIVTHDDDLHQFVTLKGFPPKVIHLFSYNLSAFLTAQFLLKNTTIIKEFISDKSSGYLFLK